MAQTKQGNKKKSGVSFKNLLSGPKTFTWSSFPEDARNSVLGQLTRTLEKIKFSKPKSDKNVKRDKKCDEDKAIENKSWNEFRPFLFIGLNQCTRALEKDCVDLLLVDQSPNPSSLTDHLKPLVAIRGVHVIRIDGISEKLAETIRMRSVIALGFSKDLPRNAELGILKNNLLGRAKKIKIPWAYRIFNHAGSVLEEGSESDVKYEQLLVKKITPNEKRPKKKKKNKK